MPIEELEGRSVTGTLRDPIILAGKLRSSLGVLSLINEGKKNLTSCSNKLEDNLLVLKHKQQQQKTHTHK